MLWLLLLLLLTPLVYNDGLSGTHTCARRYDTEVAAIQAEAERKRRAHESELQQRCDVLVKQYRAIAEQATAQASEFRQQQQIASIEKIKQDEQERVEFEKTIMDRAQALVDAATQDVKAAQEKLELERDKFARFEVEVRRQFEAHCRAFEGKIRAKAAAALEQSKPQQRQQQPPQRQAGADAQRDATVTAHQEQQKQPQSPPAAATGLAAATTTGAPDSKVSSPEDAKIRKTVMELKSYMLSLKEGGGAASVLTSPASFPTPAHPRSAGAGRPAFATAPAPAAAAQSAPPVGGPLGVREADGFLRRNTVATAKAVPFLAATTRGPLADRARAGAPSLAHLRPLRTAPTGPATSEFVDSIVRSSREDTNRMMQSLDSLY